jgi:thiosulfate/3-mercaptopyruvate sulfurtransferase
MIRHLTGLAALAASALALPALAAGPLVSPAELAGMLDDPNVVVIDVRSDLEGATETSYAEGHIPGAVYANYKSGGWRAKVNGVPGMLPPVDKIEATIAALGVDAGDQVVVVAAGHGPKALDMGAATRVYWTFKVLGHDSVSILDGGMKAWTAAGLPLSTDAPTVTAGTFTADFQDSLYADASDVAAAMTGTADLVDTRPTKHYTAEAKSGVVKRAGTVPGSSNYPITAMLDAEGSHFRAKDDLAGQMAQLGVNARRQQIAYCNTGHYGSIGWFAMSELLGDRSVKLYDGSMADWTNWRNRPTLPGKGPMVKG